MTVKVHCFGCDGGLNEIYVASGIPRYKLLRWPPPEELGAPICRVANGVLRTTRTLPSEAALDGYQSALWSHKKALAWLRGRGLRDEIIRAAGLGYDGVKNAIVIPVDDAAGVLVNVRRRFLEEDADPKILPTTGCGTQLYPLWALHGNEAFAFVPEGEIDALTLIQAGLPAITTTGGRAQHWPPEWVAFLRGRIVGVIYDADAVRFATERVAELRTGGIDAYAIDINRTGHGGKTDVNDLVAKHGWTDERLRAFLLSSRPCRWSEGGPSGRSA